MKLVSSKNALVTTLLLVGAGYAGTVSAHSKVGSLGSAASATDVYRVTCFDDGSGPPHHLVTQVRDNAPVKSPLVSVVATKGGASTTSTDPVDGNSAYSPEKELAKGNGVYTVSIKKSASGSENYALQYHCETASDLHTGTDTSQTQNQ